MRVTVAVSLSSATQLGNGGIPPADPNLVPPQCEDGILCKHRGSPSLAHTLAKPWSTALSLPVPVPLHQEGYKDVIVHKSLLEVLHDGFLGDLGEQDHVVHAALLDIVALPVEALLAALRGEGHSDCTGATTDGKGAPGLDLAPAPPELLVAIIGPGSSRGSKKGCKEGYFGHTGNLQSSKSQHCCP